MKHVKWILVVLIISSLTSFISKDKPAEGLNIGDMAPDFTIETQDGKQKINVRDTEGRYVLLTFWASYDAGSRIRNINLGHVLQAQELPVRMLSVSLDEYHSVFYETVRKDRLDESVCLVDTKGGNSDLFRRYNLKEGFANYLLNEKGVIVAKNISAEELSLSF